MLRAEHGELVVPAAVSAEVDRSKLPLRWIAARGGRQPWPIVPSITRLEDSVRHRPRLLPRQA